MRAIRPRRPGHATVVAYLALFIALSGTAAVAATKIHSDDIKNHAVKTRKLDRDAVTKTKLDEDAVQGSNVADGSLGLEETADVVVDTTISVDSLDEGCSPNDVLVPGLESGDRVAVLPRHRDHAGINAQVFPVAGEADTVPGFEQVRVWLCTFGSNIGSPVDVPVTILAFHEAP
jgi:hypothetical protein